MSRAVVLATTATLAAPKPTVTPLGVPGAQVIFDENGNGVSAKWLGGTDWQPQESIPKAVPCDTSLSSACGIDFFGQTLVGLGWLPQVCRAHGAVWDLVNGGPATDLGSLVEGSASRANAISGDGHIIVGWQDSEVGERSGARWVDGVAREQSVGRPRGWIFRNGKFIWMTEQVIGKKKFAPGWIINAITAISGDGKTIAGEGINPATKFTEGFVIENF